MGLIPQNILHVLNTLVFLTTRRKGYHNNSHFTDDKRRVKRGGVTRLHLSGKRQNQDQNPEHAMLESM